MHRIAYIIMGLDVCNDRITLAMFELTLALGRSACCTSP